MSQQIPSSIHSNNCEVRAKTIEAAHSELCRDGYTVLKKWILPEHIHQLKKAVEKQLPFIDPSDRDKVRSLGSIIPAEKSRRLTGFGLNPDLLIDLKALLGEEVIYHQGVCFSKPGNSPNTFWHQDYYAWDESRAFEKNAGQFQVLAYLRNTSKFNGALRVIPGSHLACTALHLHWKQELRSQSTAELTRKLRSHRTEYHWAYKTFTNEISVPVNAGDLIIIDSRIMHAAHSNDSAEERELLTLFYLSGIRRFSDAFKIAIYQDWVDKNNSKVNDMYSRFLFSHQCFQKMTKCPPMKNKAIMRRFPSELIKLEGVES